VWSDYPSSEAAAQNLVNDLDLVVTAPGGTQYKGNVDSVTFEVGNVTHVSNTCDTGANHDPDGDSDGTTITIPKP
jgi:hypothetical protein